MAQSLKWPGVQYLSFLAVETNKYVDGIPYFVQIAVRHYSTDAARSGPSRHTDGVPKKSRLWESGYIES